MSEEQLFTFEPADFKILEEFVHDETIQRPETIRFYTLEEQIGDAYDKMIPKGRTTKFQMEVLRKESERLRQLYQDYIVPTAETYLLREPEYGKHFNWIHPVYESAELHKFNYTEDWIPLYDEARIRLPNFYRSMMNALPKPFKTEKEGTPYSVDRPTTFVNNDGEEPVRALPTFYYPRTQKHEDGRFDILSVPMANTADSINFVGYYAKKRPVPLPNPLPDHPFLQSSDAVMVESTAPLSEVVPSLDAILTHAVPVTKDPYGEGMKYLRVYDVRLSDIPWKSWKSRFPPVEAVGEPAKPTPIDFPKSSGDKPSENLMKYYKEYYPAESTRKWLMDQIDGGELVTHMLMSQAGQNGTVAIMPGSDSAFEYPKTTVAECDLAGLDFHDFSIRGTLRRTWGPKDKMIYQCVPLELVKQERKREGYVGRKQWTETTPTAILEQYVKALVGARPVEIKPKKEDKIPSAPTREVSQLHHEIVSVLGDKQRFAEDKLRDITELIRDAILDGKNYVDSKGLFLICSHTLAILGGELAADRRAFYDTWTARVDGFRVCKSCGEHINSDVLEHQEEFDDNGRVVRGAGVLETKSFSGGHGIQDHVNSLAGLKDLFDFAKPSDEVFFMLISLIRAMPEVDQFLPILEMGRKIAAQLEKANLDGGAAGIAQMVLLIQSHNPPLIPRRSFGSKPLTLRGYPRDTSSTEGYTIVDSMILVLTKTLEAYPTSFKGSSASTMRNILNQPKKTKGLVEKTINTLIKGSAALRNALEQAKAVMPAEETTNPSTMIPGDLVMPAKEVFGSVKSLPACPTTRAYWTTSRPPRIKQPDVPLRQGINHFERTGSENKLIEESVSERVTPETLPVKDKAVVARLKMGKEGASDDWHTNVLIASRLASVFEIPVPLRTLDPNQKKDDLRDITKGYVYEIIKEISKDPLKKTKLDAMRKNDIALMMLMADVKKAAEITNTLKAKERITYTERFRLMTDPDREITKELVDRGLAPYIITKQDRILFAKEVKEKAEQGDQEIGVGRPVDYEDQGDLPITEDRVEDGNYGDYSNAANNDGRDQEQATMFDDEDTGI